MRGTFFQKPLEIQLVVDGEAWHQGDRIQGSLRLRNRGSETFDLAQIRLFLAYGLDKKVKSKADDAFETLLELKPGEGRGSVAPGGESEPMNWELQIQDNAPITDKFGSLYLLYGRGESPAELGALQLIVHPRRHFEEFIEVFGDRFQFVTKYKKAGKDGIVEVKLVPPSGRTHQSIEHLILHLVMDEQDLKSVLTFNVKELDASSPGLKFKKAKKVFERVYTPAEYLLTYSQRLNKDTVEKSIEEVIEKVRDGSLL